MAAYLKYGDAIKGETIAQGHKGSDGWVEIGSVQWGVGRGISSPVGTSAKREASAPSISEVVVTKMMDSTSPLFMQEGCIGKAVTAVVELVETGEDQLNVYLTITMTNAMISGYSMSSGGDRPSESISINFTKIEVVYQGYDDQHKIDTSKKQTFGYDLAVAKKV